MWKNILLLKRTTGWPFISIVFDPSVHKEKLSVRLLTAVTVLFLILAGSPLANMSVNTASAVSDPYVSDTTPPASVTGLHNTIYAPTYISWTWTDPADSDFSHVMIYLNGTFQANVAKDVKYYNASGLIPENTYKISIRTVDLTGNVNSTWVDNISKTAPVTIPPVQAVELTEDSVKETTTDIRWTPNSESGSGGYEISRNGTRIDYIAGLLQRFWLNLKNTINIW